MIVRDFIIQNPGADFDMMTPGGFVYLKPEQSKALLDGKPTEGHPGDPEMAVSIEAEELLKQNVLSSQYSKGAWRLLTGYPESEMVTH